MQQKPVTKMSVPQFGGWEHKPHGVPTDYSMVFNMARENKKNHKTDLTEVKRLSVGNDQRVASNTPNHHHGRGRGRGHGHGHGPSHGHNYGHGPSHGPSHGYGPVPSIVTLITLMQILLSR